MTELHEEMLSLFQTYMKETEDFEKFGKKIAAQRARMALQDMSKLIVARRKELQQQKLDG